MRSYTVFFQREVTEEQMIYVHAENFADAIKKAREELKKNLGSWECVDVAAPEMSGEAENYQKRGHYAGEQRGPVASMVHKQFEGK